MNVDAQLLHEVDAIARRGGRAIMAVYARDYAVQDKADRSPLTEADLVGHAVIADDLGQLIPSLPILSEEAVEEFPHIAICGNGRTMMPRCSCPITSV